MNKNGGEINRKLKNINKVCREKFKKKKSRNGCKWKIIKNTNLKKRRQNNRERAENKTIQVTKIQILRTKSEKKMTEVMLKN